jgi:hypothetical protein
MRTALPAARKAVARAKKTGTVIPQHVIEIFSDEEMTAIPHRKASASRAIDVDEEEIIVCKHEFPPSSSFSLPASSSSSSSLASSPSTPAPAAKRKRPGHKSSQASVQHGQSKPRLFPAAFDCAEVSSIIAATQALGKPERHTYLKENFGVPYKNSTYHEAVARWFNAPQVVREQAMGSKAEGRPPMPWVAFQAIVPLPSRSEKTEAQQASRRRAPKKAKKVRVVDEDEEESCAEESVPDVMRTERRSVINLLTDESD